MSEHGATRSIVLEPPADLLAVQGCFLRGELPEGHITVLARFWVLDFKNFFQRAEGVTWCAPLGLQCCHHGPIGGEEIHLRVRFIPDDVAELTRPDPAEILGCMPGVRLHIPNRFEPHLPCPTRRQVPDVGCQMVCRSPERGTLTACSHENHFPVWL